MDQPLKALEVLSKAEEENENDENFSLYKARIYEMISEYDKSIGLYKTIMIKNTCNFEALACIGSNYFYSDHPEVGLKYYNRIFELGVNTAEVFNNIGLCAFYSGQYDICLSCFERAILTSENNDELLADIWYNISHVGISIADFSLAEYCLKVCLQYNKNHFEALNNLGVLELKQSKKKIGLSNFEAACSLTDFTFEPYYNFAVTNYKSGNYEKALEFINKSLEIFPDHFDSQELRLTILKKLTS